MAVWDADVEVSEEVALALLQSQFPEIEAATIELKGVGWDNAAFLVDGRLIFRFPRRQMGADLIARECRILPILAGRLPLPIPRPTFIGQPENDYPYPFAGYECLAGESACAFEWTDAQRNQNAAVLGEFYKALHGIPATSEQKAWAPDDDIGRANLPRRFRQTKERVQQQPCLYAEFQPHETLELMEDLSLTMPHKAATCWVHGDSYACHLLANEQHRICGVIDWGDAHLGDPAIDLCMAWCFLPPEGREAFRDAYGPIHENAWARARFRAIYYGVLLLQYGQDVQNPGMIVASEFALRNAGPT